jgi:hypothetical protein
MALASDSKVCPGCPHKASIAQANYLHFLRLHIVVGRNPDHTLSSEDDPTRRFISGSSHCTACDFTFPSSKALRLHAMVEHFRMDTLRWCETCVIWVERRSVKRHVFKWHMNGNRFRTGHKQSGIALQI